MAISFTLILNIILFYLIEAISAYLKLVTKLKYDEKPDYEKCRKYFVDGLKSLGKSNSGELEFKASASAKKTVGVTSPVKEQRPKGRQTAKTATKVTDNVENISPKVKSARKRDTNNDSSEDSASPMKKQRTKQPPSKPTTQRSNRTSTRTAAVDVNVEKDEKEKTYHLNIEMDFSFDANVVVNVKRKKKKTPKNEPEEPNQSIQSTDEIPPSDKSFIVQTTKVYNRAQRSSPRNK